MWNAQTVLKNNYMFVQSSILMFQSHFHELISLDNVETDKHWKLSPS